MIGFSEVVTPIWSRIGHDSARLCELEDADLEALLEAHSTANAALSFSLRQQVGGCVAEVLLVKASKLAPSEVKRRADQIDAAMERGETPAPESLASHLSIQLGVARSLLSELEQRRASK